MAGAAECNTVINLTSQFGIAHEVEDMMYAKIFVTTAFAAPMAVAFKYRTVKRLILLG